MPVYRRKPPFAFTYRFLVRMTLGLALATVLIDIFFLWPSHNQPPARHNGIRDMEPPLAFRFKHNDTRGAKPSLTSVVKDVVVESDKKSSKDPRHDKEPILKLFQEAGIHVEDSDLSELPTWTQIVDIHGEHPLVEGIDKCEEFRQKVPASERMLGSSGMFNSGTNLVTLLLKGNCRIPERFDKYGPNATKEEWGMRWQVPWGKHTNAKHKWDHATRQAVSINKHHILPVVTIRDPYDWMRSMCRHSYTAKWPHHKNNCPHLIDPRTRQLLPVTVKLGDHEGHHNSLAHLWNDWYKAYDEDADYPFLMVRFEDLIFRQKETTEIICHCVGGDLHTGNNFKYIVKSAKDGPGHGSKADRTGMVDAWIKYGKKKEVMAGFNKDDYLTSIEALNHNLMKKFRYTDPPPQR